MKNKLFILIAATLLVAGTITAVQVSANDSAPVAQTQETVAPQAEEAPVETTTVTVPPVHPAPEATEAPVAPGTAPVPAPAEQPAEEPAPEPVDPATQGTLHSADMATSVCLTECNN